MNRKRTCVCALKAVQRVLRTHEEQEHSETRYFCYLCESSQKIHSNLRTHVLGHYKGNSLDPNFERTWKNYEEKTALGMIPIYNINAPRQEQPYALPNTPLVPLPRIMSDEDRLSGPRFVSAPTLLWHVNGVRGMMDNQAHRIHREVNPTVNYRASYPPSANWQQQNDNNLYYQSHYPSFPPFPSNQPAAPQNWTAPPHQRTLGTGEDPCRDLATPMTFAHASSSSSSTFPPQYGGSNPMAPPNVPLPQQQFYEHRAQRDLNHINALPSEQQLAWNSYGGGQSTSAAPSDDWNPQHLHPGGQEGQSTSSQPFYPSAPPSGSGNTVNQSRGTRRQFPSADAEYDAPESQPGCSSSSSSSGQSKRARK